MNIGKLPGGRLFLLVRTKQKNSRVPLEINGPEKF
jgi:hypothetical protein